MDELDPSAWRLIDLGPMRGVPEMGTVRDCHPFLHDLIMAWDLMLVIGDATLADWDLSGPQDA